MAKKIEFYNSQLYSRTSKLFHKVGIVQSFSPSVCDQFYHNIYWIDVIKWYQLCWQNLPIIYTYEFSCICLLCSHYMH